jgi:hypothetical protein
MIKDNNLRKTFVKEALGNRNYLSYRADLALYKMLISFAVFILIYFIYLDLILSLLIAALAFAILTLINKRSVDTKNKKGKELLFNKVKKSYFSSKIEEINTHDFEMLIRLLFKNEGYNNIIKKGRSLYLTEKEGYINCIKIFKLYEGIEVEKLDIRSLLTFMGHSGIRKGFLVTTSSLSEDAKKLLEKFKEKFEVTIIDIEGLFDLAKKYNMLPEDSFYYKKLYEEKRTISKMDVKNNMLNIKKLALYIPAAIFFYISSVWMPENQLVIFISYYFVILSVVNVLYYLRNKYITY